MAFYAVILAGGRGERFWPLSTAKRPKQLLSLVGGRTLLAQAVDRLEGLIPPERVFVITSEDLVAATCEAAPELPSANVIGEPVGRDTAAAVALAAALVKAHDPKGTFAILTADHIMGDLPLFRRTLAEGLALAETQDVLVTIGIQPSEPSTAYGYIETGDAISVRDGIAFFKGVRFVEKPNREKADEYLHTGRFFWNSGMFIWSVISLQKAMARHCPELASLMDRMAKAWTGGVFKEALEREYAQLKKISIDYALMEKADNIVVAKGLFAWDDVGSWTALENHFEKDGSNNTLIGDCVALESGSNIVYSKDGRLTALLGVDDLVVVQAEGVTLVCTRDKAQDIKKLVQQIKALGRHGALI